MWFYLFLILSAALAGGALPLFLKNAHAAISGYMMTFTGAFLLGITLLHLFPEAFEALHAKAGLFILAGFFLQFFLQKYSHGLEHGHVHPTADNQHIIMPSLLIGLCVHAFMAGIPLGFPYKNNGILPILAMGILAHKIPEAFTLMSVVTERLYKLKKEIIILILFALVTPAGALIAHLYSNYFMVMPAVVTYLMTLVAGAFLHIASTILFESNSGRHALSWGKAIAIAVGLLFALLTLLL